MKTIIVSVYDSAIQAYARPFQVPTIGAATRSFTDELKRPDSEIAQHPEDYALFEIASFTDHDGLMVPTNPPKCLARAHELLAIANAEK